MTRTEDDLKDMYRTGPATETAERRIIEWISDGARPVAPPRRARRRTWAVTGSAVAVAAVTVTVAVVVPNLDSSSHGTTALPGSTSSASVPPATASAPMSTPPAVVPITAQVAQQTLLNLLPRKGTVTARSGAAAPGTALSEMTFDDGHGAAAIDLSLSYPSTDPHAVTNEWICSADTSNPVPTGCSTLPDGSQRFQSQGYEYPDRRVDTLNWTVGVRRPDGMQIQISEWNAPTEKDTPISRPAPPFTTAELFAVASSPAWTATVSATTANSDAGLFAPDDRLQPLISRAAGGPASRAATAKAVKSAAEATVTPSR